MKESVQFKESWKGPDGGGAEAGNEGKVERWNLHKKPNDWMQRCVCALVLMCIMSCCLNMTGGGGGFTLVFCGQTVICWGVIKG